MTFSSFIDQVVENKVPNDLYLTANNNLLHRKEMRGILNDMDPFYPGFLWVDPTQVRSPRGAQMGRTMNCMWSRMISALADLGKTMIRRLLMQRGKF